MFPALKASCALVSIKRLISCFESPSVVRVSASRLLVVRSPRSNAKRAVRARIFDAVGSDAALASLNPSATLLMTISPGCWLDGDALNTCEVGGALAQPTTRPVTNRMLNNLRLMFIGLFRWSLSVFSKIGLLSVESQRTPGLARFVDNGLRWSGSSYQQSGWSSLQKQQCNALGVKSEAVNHRYLTRSLYHGFAVAIRLRSDDATGRVHREVR